ncbi:hypothetical protein ACOMHN_036429 [Nucella lapillus]
MAMRSIKFIPRCTKSRNSLRQQKWFATFTDVKPHCTNPLQFYYSPTPTTLLQNPLQSHGTNRDPLQQHPTTNLQMKGVQVRRKKALISHTQSMLKAGPYSTYALTSPRTITTIVLHFSISHTLTQSMPTARPYSTSVLPRFAS